MKTLEKQNVDVNKTNPLAKFVDIVDEQKAEDIKFSIILPLLESFDFKRYEFDSNNNQIIIRKTVPESPQNAIIVIIKDLNTNLDEYLSEFEQFFLIPYFTMGMITDGNTFKIFANNKAHNVSINESCIMSFYKKDLDNIAIYSILNKLFNKNNINSGLSKQFVTELFNERGLNKNKQNNKAEDISAYFNLKNNQLTKRYKEKHLRQFQNPNNLIYRLYTFIREKNSIDIDELRQVCIERGWSKNSSSGSINASLRTLKDMDLIKFTGIENRIIKIKNPKLPTE